MNGRASEVRGRGGRVVMPADSGAAWEAIDAQQFKGQNEGATLAAEGRARQKKRQERAHSLGRERQQQTGAQRQARLIGKQTLMNWERSGRNWKRRRRLHYPVRPGEGLPSSSGSGMSSQRLRTAACGPAVRGQEGDKITGQEAASTHRRSACTGCCPRWGSAPTDVAPLLHTAACTQLSPAGADAGGPPLAPSASCGAAASLLGLVSGLLLRSMAATSSLLLLRAGAAAAGA